MKRERFKFSMMQSRIPSADKHLIRSHEMKAIGY